MLRQLFFAERAALRPTVLRGISPRALGHAGVVGGGTMGSGIATALLAAGLRVTLAERDAASVDRAIGAVRAMTEAGIRRGSLTSAEAAGRLARITGHVGLEGFAACDLLIETVFEDIGIKRAVFADLGRLCRADAILATNTS